jgi:WG containing repeat
MNSRPRFPVFSLPTLVVCGSLCGPLAEPLTAQNLAGLRQTAELVLAAGPQSCTNETSPLFPVVERGRWGYMEKTGRIAIPPQYENADPFFEGLAQVWIGGKVGYIDTTGHFVIEPQYDPHVGASRGFSEGRAPVTVSEKIGYIDRTGNIHIMRPQMDFRRGWLR